MWRPWAAKSTGRIHDTSSKFSCSSFKDIQTLCSDDLPAVNNNPTSSVASRRTSNVFHRVRLANTVVRSWANGLSEARPNTEPETNAALSSDKAVETLQQPSITVPGAEKRVVVYFTSLRVVRRTFEDCWTVRSILRGFRVQLDERDLAMDAAFLNELQGIMGGQTKLTLPRVFIGGRYIGGVEEVRQLHEAGELKKFVEGLPAAEPGVCDLCGGYRFILCTDCDGSHKLYTEKAGFKSCSICNENGLIRCPSCSNAPL